MNQRVSLLGVQCALEKYALHLPSDHAFELGGLGVLGAPIVHSLATGEHEEDPRVTRAKHVIELAGLGMLAVPTLRKMMTT